MTTEYKCPYCGQNSYSKASKKEGIFTDWSSVIRHTSSCNKNDNSFILTKEYGPLLTEYVLNTDLKELKSKYPKVRFSDKLKHLKRNNIIANKRSLKLEYTKDSITAYILTYVQETGKIPTNRDTIGTIFPSNKPIRALFGTWNAAIEAAGFTPNTQNGFGVNTKAKDGHLYRSRAEAYFVDTYLYGIYDYIIEPKYPEPYNKIYDWYIPSLDLYIELDGGIRPLIIQEKIEINKLLNRNCIIISVKDVYDPSFTLT